MAQFPNMYPVDLADGHAAVVSLNQMYLGNAYANRVGAIVTDHGENVALGGSCAGTAVLADGSTVALTGTVSGNKIYCDLPSGAYAVNGPIEVFITWVSGENKTTLLAGFGNVRRTETGTYIDPGTIISDVAALIESINTAVASIPADYSDLLAAIAPTFDPASATDYAAGTYVWYSGALYRFTADHAAGTAWSGTDAAPVTVAGEIHGLKSAINTDEALLGKSPAGNLLAQQQIVTSRIYPSNQAAGTTLADEANASFSIIKYPVNAGEIYSINVGVSSLSPSRCYVVDFNSAVIERLNNCAISAGVYEMPANAAYICLSYQNANYATNGIVVLFGNNLSAYSATVTTYPYGEQVYALTGVDEAKIAYLNLIQNQGKNRFDKGAIISGFYLSDANGFLQYNADYFTSGFIWVHDWAAFTVSSTSAFTSTYIVLYDENKAVISGQSGGTSQTAVTVQNTGNAAYYARFSNRLTAIDNCQIEAGSSATGYTSSLGEKIKKKYLYKNPQVLEVSPYGDKDFLTIKAAYEYADTIQSKTNPITILIYPGVYKEKVNSGYHKYISFIGANKHDVIWRYDSGIYGDDPLMYANCGMIKGITFISTHDDTADYETTYAGTEQTNYASYGLHLDSNVYTTSLNTDPFETIVEDCIIVCKQAPAIGCGMQPYQKLTLKDCELVMDIPPALLTAHDSAAKGCMLIHRAFIDDIGGNPTPQDATIANLIIRTNTGLSWQIGKLSAQQSGFIVHLYNNISWSEINGKSSSSVHNLTAEVPLADDCFGNNVTAINK